MVGGRMAVPGAAEFGNGAPADIIGNFNIF